LSGHTCDRFPWYDGVMATLTSRHAPPQGDTPELQKYYDDLPRMWKNLGLIALCNVGWNAVGQLAWPLMQLRMSKMGLGEGAMGTIMSINLFAVSLLVMYFSWRSDHTVSRFGRRMPYTFLATPFIVATTMLFWIPDTLWSLIILTCVYLLFQDLKASTFPLLNYDCVRRDLIARANAVFSMIGAGVGFFAMKYGMIMTRGPEWVPYVVAGLIMLISAAPLVLVREPPFRNPATTPFRPWSALAIGWRDKRNIVLMLGVGLVHSFLSAYGSWVWLYASKNLGLNEESIAGALSWSLLVGVAVAMPVAWVIDKLGAMKIVIPFVVIQGVMLWLLLTGTGANGLAFVALMSAALWPMYQAADMLIIKSAPGKDMGSFTSSNSFLRNCNQGFVMLSMGWIIQGTGGNYHLAFICSFGVSLIGLGCILLHRFLIRNDPAAVVI
jgi:Na+/melibiose symporter-like transporter